MSRSQRTFDLLMKLWPLGKAVNWLGNRRLVGPFLRPCFSPRDNEAIIIPVQEVVQGTESVVLPYPLLAPVVERASARFVLDECLCRRSEGCQTYPRDIGCLFLGQGAGEINPALGRTAKVDEALAHIERAMGKGLVPLVVHASFDAWLLGIPYHRMLAVCFCCDCCCTVREGLRMGPPAFWETVVRLPGLSVTVEGACNGCGACLEVCHIGAISLEAGQAHISERCKGCGRCALVCPVQAISLRIDGGVDVLGRLLDRIEQRTDIH